MKRIFIKSITLLLVAIFSISAVACSNEESKGKGTTKQSVFDGGIHVYDYTETNNYVVENATSQYKIVIKDSSTEKLQFAAEELKNLFLEATNILLPIVSESTVSYSDDAKFICLGLNTLSEQAGISIDDKNLGREGFVIETVGKNIYILANEDIGVLWGVYGFLQLEFNFEQFSDNVYTLDKNVSKMKLRDYSVVDVPDIRVRASLGSWLGKTGLRRMRYSLKAEQDDYKLGPVTGAHTWNIHLSEATDYVEHPAWYATTGDQMCYNANGIPEEYEALIQRLVEVIKGYMIKYPDGYIFNLGHGDYFTWCSCEACTTQISQYGGSRLAGGIKLLNEVATRVDAWLETEEGKAYQREYYLMILSYGMTLQPPARYNETTEAWEPIDNSVICHKRVIPQYAPLEIDYQQELYSSVNKQYVDYWYGWQALSEKMGFYTYSGNYNHIMTPVDMFQNLQQYYQLAAKSNAVYLIEDTISNAGTMSAWQVLRNYIVSKLGWNVNEDMGKLVDKFFDVYFADASDSMRSFYESFKTWAVHQEHNLAATHGIYANITLAELWPKDLLDQWLALTEQAVKDISFYQYVDPQQYQIYYDNIAAERVSIQYLMIEFYEKSYDEEFILKQKLQCKEDCVRLGINKVRGSSNTMSNYFVKWGV